MKNQKGSIQLIAGIFVFVLLIAVFAIPQYASVDNVNDVYIKDKERIVQSESSYYLVYTDKGVFKNTDNIYFLKFGSSDLYNELEVGTTCDLKVNWFRVPFFSMYENILEAHCQ